MKGKQTMKILITTMLVCIIFIGSQQLYAQPFGGPPPHGRGRIEQLRKLKLIEVLNLKEDEAVRFFAKLNEHENKMENIQKERGELLDSLELLVKLNSADKSLEGIFDALMESESKMLNERKSFRSEAKKLLSTQQQAKWLLFERKFWDNVRDSREEMMRDNMKERRRERRDERDE